MKTSYAGEYQEMRRIITLIMLSTPLSGCGRTTEGTLAQVCGDNGWREIGVRKKDVITDDTGREIVGNNKARDAWCNKKA